MKDTRKSKHVVFYDHNERDQKIYMYFKNNPSERFGTIVKKMLIDYIDGNPVAYEKPVVKEKTIQKRISFMDQIKNIQK